MAGTTDSASLALARRVLRIQHRLELGSTAAVFLLMVLALAIDVAGRELLGQGALWATPVAVYANVFLSFIGMGVASAHNAHLRPRFLDRAAPRALQPVFERLPDAGFALFCGGAAWLCARMLAETIELAETDPVLQWPLWPFQAVLVAGFSLGALRHALYAAFPPLRPSADGSENAPPTEAQVRALAGGQGAATAASSSTSNATSGAILPAAGAPAAAPGDSAGPQREQGR